MFAIGAKRTFGPHDPAQPTTNSTGPASSLPMIICVGRGVIQPDVFTLRLVQKIRQARTALIQHLDRVTQ